MMMIISYMFSTPKEIYIFNRYSIFYVIEVTGIWMLFKNFNKLNFNIKFISNPDGIFRKFCSTLAKYSYGMYLTHVAFLSIAWYFLPANHSCCQ